MADSSGVSSHEIIVMTEKVIKIATKSFIKAIQTDKIIVRTLEGVAVGETTGTRGERISTL